MCGSHEHPNPAHSELAIPTEEQLEAAQQQLDSKRSTCEALRSDYRSVRDQISNLDKQLAPLFEVLQLEASLTLEQVPLAAWQQQWGEIKQQFASAQQAQQQLTQQQQQLQRIDEHNRTATASECCSAAGR